MSGYFSSSADSNSRYTGTWIRTLGISIIGLLDSH
jgi:hypothetical protein